MDASQRALIAEYDQLLSASSTPQAGDNRIIIDAEVTIPMDFPATVSWRLWATVCCLFAQVVRSSLRRCKVRQSSKAQEEGRRCAFAPKPHRRRSKRLPCFEAWARVMIAALSEGRAIQGERGPL